MCSTLLVRPIQLLLQNRRWELTVERGGVLWGIRVLVATKLRKEVLGMLHDSHSEIVSRKRQARRLLSHRSGFQTVV